MTTDVRRWLEVHGLDQYAEAFAANDVGWSLLARLTAEDLKELGLSVGHRRRFLDAVAELAIAPALVVAAERPAAHAPRVSDAGGEAERRQLTVLFCDLVGSTELTQRLDPEELRELNRAYQDAATEAIRSVGGYVARYMGDGVLAYFGYPEAHEDDAERAVRAGLRLTERIPALDVGTRLAVRVGIATGPVVVGDLIGESASQERAAVGEAPNLAARLQGEAPPGAVVVSDSTHRLVEGLFECADLGRRRLRGFEREQGVWRVTGERSVESRFDALHPRDLTPLVGRDSELGLLLDRWEAACGGEGQMVLLGGEPGIGKSRMLVALRDAIVGTPHFELRFQCSPHQVNSALHPVSRHLATAAGFAPHDAPGERLRRIRELVVGRDECEERVRLIADLLAVPLDATFPPIELTPEERKERTLQALERQLLDLVAARPVAFLFEDAHWSDPTTLELLERTARRAAEARLLLVLTHRPEWSPPFAARSNVTVLSLNRLGRTAGAAMVRAVASRAIPDETVARIVAHCDGIPLFVEELTKAVIEAGGVLEETAIPTTLQASLLARLDRLGADAKAVAQIGAAIGREFRYGLLAEIAGKPIAQLEDALARLVGADLVFRSGHPPAASYAFKHALVQDAAYDSLLLARRRALHAAIITALEGGAEGDANEVVDLLAYHARLAGLTEKAVRYARLAAEKATERSAYAEAWRLLESAIETLGVEPGHAQEGVRIRLAMRPCLGAFGEYERLLEVLSEAVELAETAGDGTSGVVASIHRAHVLYHHGRIEEGIAQGERALAAARALGEPLRIVSANAVLAMAHFFRGDLRTAAERAGTDAETLRGPLRYARLETTATSSVNWLSNLAAMHALLGEFALADEFSAESLAIAEETDKPFDRGMATQWHGHVLVAEGRGEAARTLLEPASRLCEEHRMLFLLPWTLRPLGESLVLTGEPARAREVHAEAIRVAQRLGLRLSVIWNTAGLAAADLAAGDVVAAIAHAEAAVEMAGAAGWRWIDALACRHLAHARRAAGHPALACETLLGRSLTGFEACEARPEIAHGHRALAAHLASIDRGTDARVHLDRALEGYRSLGNPRWTHEVESSIAEIS